MPRPTRFASFVLPLVANAIKPCLARDAKIDLMPIFKDLSTKNFKPKRVMMALDAALKGKLAQDAEPHMGHVAALLDHIEHTVGEPKSLDESVSEAQHKAMGAAAGGKSNLGIPKAVGKEFAEADKGKSFDRAAIDAYLADHGMDEETRKGAMDLLPHVEEEKEEEEGEDAEHQEGEIGEKQWATDDKDDGQEPGWKHKEAEDAEEESEGTRKKDLDTEEEGAHSSEEREEPKAGDKRRGAKDKFPRRGGKDSARDGAKDKFPKHALDSNDMVTKQSMDAAINAATKATVARLRAIDRAKADIRPYVGELSMAFDSAEDVYGAALRMRNVDVKGIHPTAFPKILSLLPKAGAKEVERGSNSMAMDEDKRDRLNQMFPGLSRIGQA